MVVCSKNIPYYWYAVEWTVFFFPSYSPSPSPPHDPKKGGG